MGRQLLLQTDMTQDSVCPCRANQRAGKTCKVGISGHQQLGRHLLEVLEEEPRLLLPRVHALAEHVHAQVVQDPGLDPSHDHDLGDLVDLPAEEVGAHGLHDEELHLLGAHAAVLGDLLEAQAPLLLRLPEGELHQREGAHLGPQHRGLRRLERGRRVDLRPVLGEGRVVEVEFPLAEGLEQLLDPRLRRAVEAGQEVLLQELSEVELLLGDERGGADLEGELRAVLLGDRGQRREGQVQDGALVEVLPPVEGLPQQGLRLLELRLDHCIDLVRIVDLLAKRVQQLLRLVGLPLERQLLAL
mmetsp:Transcript_72805/g.163002  ORF Transcript_72805/g.163002 Transcript_72805/m.163002 type:complete len:301 (+) Transcript_72805:39-941(+)